MLINQQRPTESWVLINQCSTATLHVSLLRKNIQNIESGVKVTPNLRGATLVDFFFVKKMKVRQLRYHFPKKVSKNIKTRASY